MSADGWSSVLVLGGIRSGKSAFAEALVASAPSVRYVATAVGGEDDPEWRGRIEAHQRRRPQSWTTEETGADPARLAVLLAEAKPDDTLLVDDLGGWVAGLLDPANQPNDDVATVTALAEAVRSCAARVVVVSPEVGLSLVPATPVGRAFADALGTANQALADACDRVAFVVAGRPTWLKTGAAEPGIVTDVQAEEGTAEVPAAPHDAMTAATPPARVAAVAAAAPARPLSFDRAESSGPTAPVASDTVIEAGMDLPLPDGDAGPDARDRLERVDLPGAGIGVLIEAVEFAAGTQATATPRPWGRVRVLLLDGRHDGGAAAGADPRDSDRRAAEAEAGEGALARLAATADADIAVVRVPASGAMEDGPVLDAATVDAALRQGWELAFAAADDGRDALIIGACGTGTDAAATAVVAATTGAEPVAVLPRVLLPGGRYDDEAWMRRCAAVRDAMHRVRQEPRGAKDVLAQLGGADLAVATGAVLGAAARRIPVLVDGPVGIAAGLVARDLSSQSRHWLLLADAGRQELVRQGADVLGLTAVLELGLDLGEGANALATLPLLRSAIALAGLLPVHPALLTTPGDGGLSDDDAEFLEPEPDGPGPASV
ncbi:bifunctional adenosylcobinamide kinase/adenosylcobinamide-phosphate guanylyltransferase [Couchioplanes caeruleus]|uniref:bifunctional adenosylcobinamide kinase/adenosylcobinamide-phosphate guanylyltransferase n=1 Tax=Couchioplanes caeruleus TaxID=56438 RepID=UPI00201C0840|nr:bifunctional adenosylcobinamide kinase/adenosylcobinamide-phosphate guanylyltransferase [Couchioplanes caeruleus]UQU63285.1 bifunctional adenosylcobinamide kinase/adenosylcobinamide-phosphate guanylyltransferase [Couchioplanes caeruleus]